MQNRNSVLPDGTFSKNLNNSKYYLRTTGDEILSQEEAVTSIALALEDVNIL